MTRGRVRAFLAAWLEPALHLLAPATASAPVDRQLVEHHLASMLRKECLAILKTAILLHVAVIAFGIFTLERPFQPAAFAIHGTLLVLDVLFLALRRGANAASYLYWTSLCMIASYGMWAYQIHQAPPSTFTNLVMSQVSGILAAALVTCPFGGYRLAAMALLTIVAPSVAVYPGDASYGWMFANDTAMLGMAAFRLGSLAAKRRLAADEVKARLLIAPRQVVRASLASELRLDELFRPEARPCAFLLADRRGATVAEMHAFHATCDDLLQANVRDGAYFTDWIGSDLFIVIYGDKGGTPERALAAAIAVARGLLAAKPRFAAAEDALDLGISGGTALVGIMGPPSIRKATAIGEAAGRARRYLAAGALVRASLGREDRILLDAVAAASSAARGAAIYELVAGESVRDVDERRISFLTAAPASEDRHGSAA